MLSPPGEMRWRTENLGYLLFTARDRCIADKLAVLHQRGFGQVTDAQLTLFHHLGPGGSRLTDIAMSAGMTKSSISEIVARAAVLGLVERLPDVGDRRAKRVSYTPAGNDFFCHLDAAIAFADRRFAALIGDEALRRVTVALANYGERPADPNIGRLLSGAAKRFVRHVLEEVRDHGHPDIGEPQLNLFRTLELGGSRLTDLAARAGVTKQSMRETIGLTAVLGHVGYHPDPHDGRARTITFTPAGLTMLDQFGEAVASAERACAGQLGDGALADLRQQLNTYIAATDQAKLRPTNQ